MKTFLLLVITTKICTKSKKTAGKRQLAARARRDLGAVARSVAAPVRGPRHLRLGRPLPTRWALHCAPYACAGQGFCFHGHGDGARFRLFADSWHPRADTSATRGLAMQAAAKERCKTARVEASAARLAFKRAVGEHAAP